MLFCLLQKWYHGFLSRSPKYYYGREERPNTGLAEISLLPPGEWHEADEKLEALKHYFGTNMYTAFRALPEIDEMD